MAAEPMLRAPKPERLPESIPAPGVWPKPTLVKLLSSAHASAANSNRINLLLRRQSPARCAQTRVACSKLLCRAWGRAGELEQGVRGRHICFGLLELHFLTVAGAFRTRLHRERQVDSLYFFIVAIIGDGFVGHPMLDAPVDCADFEEVI